MKRNRKTAALFGGLVKGTLLVVIALAAAAGCKKETEIKIGLQGEELVPAWEEAARLAAKEGIRIKFVNFGDYSQPNRALADGSIDLNSFQHDAFLQNEISNHGYKIESFGNTVLFFLGVYSRKIPSLEYLKDGDTIVIMNDATNEGRALKVLEAAGVISVDPSKGNVPALRDIISNPKNIKFIEVDASQTWRMLDDPQVAAAAVNSSYVVDGGGMPSRDAIFIKPIDPAGDKPYINLIVGRSADRDNQLYKRIVALFQSPEVKQVIDTQKPTAGTALTAW